MTRSTLPRLTGSVLVELSRSEAIQLSPRRFDLAQLELTDAVIAALRQNVPNAGEWLEGNANARGLDLTAPILEAIVSSEAIDAVLVDDVKLRELVNRVVQLFTAAAPVDFQRANETMESIQSPVDGEHAFYDALMSMAGSSAETGKR